MASWRDGYREGSFKGVDFLTKAHEKKGGRRKKKRQFAKRDEGNTEDLGKELADFAIDIFVLGDDYFEERDALIEALESEGPGVLIHPYLGTFSVQAGLYSLVEDTDEGGIARFKVEFSISGDPVFPDQTADDISGTLANADNLSNNAKSAFEVVFDVAKEAAFVAQSAADAVNAVADFMTDTVAKITGPIAELTFFVSNLKADVRALINLPGELADRIAEMFDTMLAEFSSDPDTASRILGTFTATDSGISAGVDDGTSTIFDPIPPTDTPSRDKQRENLDAIVALTREVALANDAAQIVQIDFLSTGAALEKQAEIVEQLDIQLDAAIDDELFQAIKDVQTSITRVIPRTGTTELLTIDVPRTVPALVIAHAEFEDLDKEAEILDQNKIDHPGFVSGGSEIEVSAG